MQKVKQLATLVAASGISLAAFASTVLAQGYSYSYGTDTSTAAADSATSGAVGTVFLVCYCLLLLIALVGIAFSIWMLIDALKRSEAEVPNKIVWILLIIFTTWIGSLLYFFMVKKKLDKGQRATPVTPVTPAA